MSKKFIFRIMKMTWIKVKTNKNILKINKEKKNCVSKQTKREIICSEKTEDLNPTQPEKSLILEEIHLNISDETLYERFKIYFDFFVINLI